MKQILTVLMLSFFFSTSQSNPVQAQNTQEQHEIVFWESIRDKNTPEYFTAYLQQYPDGEYAILAELKLEHSKIRLERSVSRQKRYEKHYSVFSTWLIVMIVSGFLAMAWVIHIPFIGWWDDWKKARKS